eukprot:gene21372-27402_t
MRVLLLVETVEERVVIAAMFTAAEYIVNPTNPIPITYSSKIKEVFDECASLQRHFIDTFATSHAFVGSMLLELKDSLLLVNGVDDLRKGFVLNPVDQGDQMGAYAKKALSATSSVSAYTEIMSASIQYPDFVVYAFIACPALLFEEPVLEVLKAATSHRALVTIHRDITLNVHMELEKITNSYPSPTDTSLVVPKNYKVKSVLKHISRDSVNHAGLNARKRRAFVGAELSVLNNMIQMTPGLIAPKLPMLLAAASMAKGELISYFQHLEPFAVRKDSRSDFNHAHYQAEDISALLQEVQTTARLLKKHRLLVTDYYLEFLTTNDLRAITHHSAEGSRAVANLSVYFTAFVDELKLLKDTTASGSIVETNGLQGLRLNWDRTLALASTQTMHTTMKSAGLAFEKLTERMYAVTDRSLYLDNLDLLLKTHVEPYEIQWFRKSYLASFASTYKEPYSYTRFVFAYFNVFETIGLNSHPDCPEENAVLGSRVVLLCNTMLSELSDFVLTLVRYLWDNISALEAQCHPIEAARRLERSQHSKHQGGGTGQEAYPGCESEVWAKKQIEKYVLIRGHLTLIMGAARGAGAFTVHTRAYRPAVYMHQQVVKYFSDRLHSLFIAPSGERPVTRYSLALQKLNAGCRSIQFALGFVDSGVEAALKDLFFRELQDAAVSPPGLSTPLSMTLTSKSTLIHKLSTWFVGLGDYISTHNKASAGGIVWVPSQDLFMSNARRKYHTTDVSDISPRSRGNSHAAPQGSLAGGDTFAALSVELFVDQDELRELASFIGVQGVKAIEHQLLTRVVIEIKAIVKFLTDYRTNLLSFESTYCLNVNAALGMSGVDGLQEALKTVGIFLLLRQMLLSAVRSVSADKYADLFHAVRTAAENVNPWAATDLLAPLSCLASSLGQVDELDLSLFAFVSQLKLKPEDIQSLKLFPVAAASLFVSEQWTKSHFISHVEAFNDNEHAIQFAAAKLMTCFFSLLSNSGSTNGDEEVVDTRFAVPHINKVHEQKSKYLAYVSRYLSISAQTLLTLRSSEQEKSLHFPYRAMSLMLDFFVRHCSGSAVDLGLLEKVFPNALTHSSLLDITMGKQLYMDSARPFSHSTQTAE